MKENRGITLISLVITIIILIILAGITIISISGENGLINRIQKASIEQKKSDYDEQIKIIIMEAKLEKENGSPETLIKIIENRLKRNKWCKSVLMYDSKGILVEDNGIELIVITKDNYEIGIKIENGNAEIEYINNKVSETFTITYDSNDGANQTVTQEIKKGKKSLLKENIFTRENYTFVGWVENENAEIIYQENSLYPENGIETNTTLYAKWSLNTVNITYKGNGGTLENEQTQLVIKVQTNSKITLPENIFTFPNYEFVCWVDTNGREYEAGSEFSILEENIELSAKWKKKILYITYNGNGGILQDSNTQKVQSIQSGSKVVISDEGFTREGYWFVEWNTKSDRNGIKYEEGQEFNITENIVLYAIWGKYVNITFNGNGETGGTMEQLIVKEGENITLPTNSFKKDGYAFTEWNTRAAGMGISYKNRTTIENITNNITLYAIWEVDQFKDLTIGTAQNSNKYGWKVKNYTIQTEQMSSNVWRLFYQDMNYTYLQTDCLVDCSTYITLYKTLYNDGSDVSSVGRGLNHMVEGFFTSENKMTRVRWVACLTDWTLWSDFCNEDAVFAIGSPTLELYAYSYNSTGPTKRINPSAKGGYYTESSELSSLPRNNHCLYIPKESFSSYWLASPTIGNDHCVVVRCNGLDYQRLLCRGTDTCKVNASNGKTRPIVCIPTTTFNNKYTLADEW